ncbi:sensor histidine kinase [Tibeticola sp.]|uniref:sensor histidine kinase n=1 Tax=Tibeticola sp. TaxID=2005368 RepID=UPI0025D4AB0A|nr:sensor histidine kinase [Tibeticola sp.]
MKRHEQRSLFGEILDWMLTPLLLLWPISLALTWFVAQGLANKPFDRTLEYNAYALAELLSVQDGHVHLNLTPSGTGVLRADESDVVYFQVLAPSGALLAGERDLPPPPADAVVASDEVHLRDAELHGADVRVAYIWVHLPESGFHPALVQVAETRNKRSVLATEIIKGVLLPQIFVLPLALLLVWLALTRGLKPLHQLEDRIRRRKPGDLSPLDDKAVPIEVAPLVESVNDLLDRLHDSVATQKRFLADAAHQLKTPLAGLRMQADLAQRGDTSTEELKKSLLQIGRASVRATHTVNQLLSLARAEGGAATLQRQHVNLAQIVIEAVHDSVPHALEKHIDLGYDGAPATDAGALLEGNATLLAELVRNLLDNAINYAPSSASQPGMVTARVVTDPFGQVLILQVENTGPGIPAAERELIFQPFYRSLGHEADGSGLGLPIVREIARQHGAQITIDALQPGARQPGTRFTVRFAPLAQPRGLPIA